jgi:HAE1 family hydrophobic/amphiphilic exporter-1
VVIDRDLAADLGVEAEPVASALATLVGGEPVSTFKERDEQYDVWLRAESRQRTDRQAIADLLIPTSDGRLIPLGSFTRSEERRGPTQIERLNRQRRTTVGANLEGLSTGEAVDALVGEAEALDLPVGYDFRKGYRSRNLDEVAVNFILAFALSLVFMYMVLAAQFESFTDPITILLALPLTFPFALISLGCWASRWTSTRSSACSCSSGSSRRTASCRSTTPTSFGAGGSPATRRSSRPTGPGSARS